MSNPKYTTIGGQAVIEGVMMRSPHFIAIAVRKPNGKILVKYEEVNSWSKRYALLKKPIIRGVATLIESMIHGMKALAFSAEIASEEDQGESEKLTSAAIVGSMVFAFVMGIALFVALPHFLTTFISADIKSPLFHFVDGLIKMMILLIYVWGISLIKDIYRVFQYHGAEHKSIYDFEEKGPLTVVSAMRHTTLHPRCGTSFLLFLVLISILVFALFFPVLGIANFTSYPIINHLLAIVVKTMFMFPVAGLSYEFIKACAFRMDSPIFKTLIWPGLMLQKFTTKEPDAKQLEVGLVALKRVLLLEELRLAPGGIESEKNMIEIESLSDLSQNELKVSIDQFQEA